MDLELKTALDAHAKAWEAFKATNEQRLAALEAKAPTYDLDVKLRTINEAIDNTSAELKAIEQRMAAGASGKTGDEQKAAERKSFADFLRKGASPESLKAMRVGDDANGGYLVPTAVTGPLFQRIFDGSPIRQIARVIGISGAALEGVTSYGQAGVTWLDEITEATNAQSTTPTLKKYRIDVHAQRSAPQIGQFLLEDAAYDVEAELMRVLGRDFALSEQTAFVSGSGSGQPKGFTSYTTAATADSSRTWGQLEHVATGTSGSFGTTSNGVDKITDLVYKLKSGYRQNATFVMSKQTLGTLRQLKASSGDYIWAPSVIAGSQQWTPSRLLGYPVVEAEDMPTIAANSLSIAFGDFNAGYVIVDRSGMSVLRDPYSNAPYVTFRTVRRVGGGVVDFDAIKLLKFA
jgi:HK97 family phage major capsid protein